MKIKILYEINSAGARIAFVENGIYYGSDSRRLGFYAELSELTAEERAVIWDNCEHRGDDCFIYEGGQIGKVCCTARELVGEIIKTTTGSRI